MSKTQLFVKNEADETVLLQLSDSSPVKLTLSVTDLNPFSPASFYSQTFSVPGIGPNTKFFQDVYNVNGVSFNPAITAQAWILQDGFLFSNGNLNLKSVSVNEKTGSISYQVFFMGDVSDFSSAVGENGLNTIDTSEINHELNYSNVITSWGASGGTTGGLKDGNVIYPLIEWGYDYDANTKIPIQPTLSQGFQGSFTQGPTAGLLMEQMKPAVRVKWIWDKIMSDAGYTYTSTFLNSDLFDSLYMSSDSATRPTFTAEPGICEVTSKRFTIPVGTEIKVPYDVVLSDPAFAFNIGQSEWVCPVDGTYSFFVEGKCQLDPFFPTTPSAAFRVAFFINDVLTSWSSIITTISPSSAITWSEVLTSSPLLRGDRVSFRIEQLSFGNSNAIFFDNSFSCLVAPNDVVLSSLFPTESIMKKIDFIRSITKCFNLVFSPSKTVQNEFLIEPWIDWILLGKERDWTKYFDGSTPTVSSPVFMDQQKVIQFKGQQDDDWLNKQVQDQTKFDWQFRQIDSDIEVLRGKQEIVTGFAGTPMQSIPANTTSFPDWVFPSCGRINPGIAEQPNSGQMQPITPKPRLVFYNGLQATPVSWYLSNVIGDSSAGQIQSQYPLVSPYSAWPPNLFTTLNFNFRSKTQTWSPFSSYVGQTSSDLYTEYWEEYVNWLYDPFNRKVQATLRLDPAEIQELEFNDKIWIKDSWYFVQKVTDYVVGEAGLLRCDLVKVPLPAIPNPIPTSATGGTAGTTCRQLYICNNNAIGTESTYTYIDCDETLVSITLQGQTCAADLCALFPLPYSLPVGWSVVDGGDCGGILVPFQLQLISEDSVTAYTTVTIDGSPGGTAGPYTRMKNYTVIGEQNLPFLLSSLPQGFGIQLSLSSSLIPGELITSSYVELAVNGVTGARITQSSTYQPIEQKLPAVTTFGNTYSGTAFINY
jgi:hypothetical protein